MPDTHGPWDGGSFGQAQYLRDRGPLEPSGVLGQPQIPSSGAALGELSLTAAGSTLSLGIGRAHVRGAAYERTGSAWTATPAANGSGNPRIDRVVLRRDAVAKTVTPVIIQGTPAAVPVAPALTQVENGSWDLPLFRYTMGANQTNPTNIVDERLWITATTDTTYRPLTINSPLTVGSDGAYYRVKGGWVSVNLHVTYAANGPYTSGFVIATLPNEAVPSVKCWFDALFYGADQRSEITISATGAISFSRTVTSSAGFTLTANFPAA
jgi:hypothetical protein